MLELPALPNTFSSAAPSLLKVMSIFLFGAPHHCQGIYNWAVKQPCLEMWHAGSWHLGTRSGGMWHFYIHVAGQKKVVVVAAAFFLHLHSLHTLFAVGSAFGVAPGHLGRWKLGKSLEAGGLFSCAIPIRLHNL